MSIAKIINTNETPTRRQMCCSRYGSVACCLLLQQKRGFGNFPLFTASRGIPDTVALARAPSTTLDTQRKHNRISIGVIPTTTYDDLKGKDLATHTNLGKQSSATLRT